MINIKLLDDSVKKYPIGITPIDIAKDIKNDFFKSVLFATINDNEEIDLLKKINNDTKITFYTWDDNIFRKYFWTSSLYLFAQTIKEIYPSIKLYKGCVSQKGFYYDIDFNSENFSKQDFIKIEKKFIINAFKCKKIKTYSLSKKDALKLYKDDIYKLYIIKKNYKNKINFYTQNNFNDIYINKHINDTSLIKSFKIVKIINYLWKKNSKNRKISRIYCVSYPDNKYLEKNKILDHKDLGKTLELFTFSKNVGSGLPLWLPKGADLRYRLENFLKKIQKKSGYEMVITPHIGHKELYEISGHWDKYKENSFKPIKTPRYNEQFLLKPMNCPHHCEIYKFQQKSYKDLPKRFAEFGTVYRYEKSGEIHGLIRTRGFTQDDAHIFCTEDQLLEEFKLSIDLILYIFKSLNFKKYTAQISLRDPKHLENYIGNDFYWKKAEKSIIKSSKEKGLKTKLIYGEAAFYGPKLDFIIKDSLDRDWQLGTIQVDYNLPERFNLSYKGKDNKLHRPVMIHRAIFGSLERFIAILLEHTSGNLPLWIIPYQAVILTISKNHVNYARNVLNLLSKSNIRIFIDESNEKINKKIKNAEIKKIPFIIIIGDKEKKDNCISIRKHKYGELGIFTIEKFISLIKKNINCL